MKNLIKLNDQPIETFTFPGGEVHVKVPDGSWRQGPHTITAHLADSEGIMQLLMLTNALREFCSPYKPVIRLRMPYCPYARQDRVCNKGEALSIKVFADLINAQNYNYVETWDPHSDVTPALFNNMDAISIVDLLYQKSYRARFKEMSFVAPDAGAAKKVFKVAQTFGVEFIQAEKRRDLATGELSGFGYQGDVQGKDLLIVDDICDGGGTFVGLGAKLKEGEANSVSLYVTHGIFSKGFDVFDGVIDKIYTTVSVVPDTPYTNPIIEVL